MNSEVNTLQNLKISLEHDQGSGLALIAVLEKHYDYLEESLSVLMNSHSSREDQQLHLVRLIHVLNMHFRAKEEVVYPILMHADNKELRLKTHICQQEADLVFQLIEEIKAGSMSSTWSDPLDAKTNVMASLLKNHLTEEARMLFPLAKKFLSSSALESMTEPYLARCIHYLGRELLKFQLFDESAADSFYLPDSFRPRAHQHSTSVRH